MNTSMDDILSGSSDLNTAFLSTSNSDASFSSIAATSAMPRPTLNVRRTQIRKTAAPKTAARKLRRFATKLRGVRGNRAALIQAFALNNPRIAPRDLFRVVKSLSDKGQDNRRLSFTDTPNTSFAE